jgi:hypothetical protein
MKIFRFLLPSLFLVSACGKIEDQEKTPPCIMNRISDFQKKEACPQNAEVRLYEFQNEMVYVLDPGYCIDDGTSEVISEKCVTLGYLGGIAGFYEINGESFSKAKFVMTVWSN